MLGFGEDGLGVFGPDEGFAAVVPAVDEAADCVFEVAGRIEGAAPDGGSSPTP